MTNGTMLQGFSWYLPADGSHWRRIAEQAPSFAYEGITAVWMPPAYKGQAGAQDVGYGVYDTYDLGEFDQKGSVATKYGTRAEYRAAIGALHANGIQALADVVLNQRLGADGCEDVLAQEVLGSDVDVNDPRVYEELVRWGRWYVDECSLDGFRLDALKHIDRQLHRIAREIAEDTEEMRA